MLSAGWTTQTVLTVTQRLVSFGWLCSECNLEDATMYFLFRWLLDQTGPRDFCFRLIPPYLWISQERSKKELQTLLLLFLIVIEKVKCG